MPIYTIKDIEKLSGVKAHTLRIWEKRYSILPSKRSESNIRYYNDEDLQYILNIAFLNKQGLKISKIANLSPEEIREKVAGYCNINNENQEKLDSLTLSMFELNEHKFLKIINHKIQDFGFEYTMEEIIYPFLDKLSLMWMSGSVKSIHENFVSSIFRRKLSVEIDKLDPVFDPEAKKFLIYLPELEAHELSLLFIYYMLRKMGVNVLYLGSQIPLIDVVEGVRVFKPDYIFTLFNTSFDNAPIAPYLEDIHKYAPETHLIISGYQVFNQGIKGTDRLTIINDITQIKTILHGQLAVG